MYEKIVIFSIALALYFFFYSAKAQEFSDLIPLTHIGLGPIGTINVPRDWVAERGTQFFFKTPNDVLMMISVSKYDELEFNKDKKQKGLDFLQAYFEIEEKHDQKLGLTDEIIETSKKDQYILWKASGQIGRQTLANYFYGVFHEVFFV